jgi:predicted aminopeptidase
VFEFAKAGSEPVVEVHTAKYRLHCFQGEYAIHYRTYVSERARGDEVRSLHAQSLDVLVVLREVIAIHVFDVRRYK